MRSFAALLLLPGLGVGHGAGALVPSDRYPLAAEAYVVAIGNSVQWARDADRSLPPASLTKLMTAIVLLDSTWDPAALVTVSLEAARATGTRAGLAAGEQWRAGDLLAALLVRSANDACVALAEYHSGTVARFVQRMNAKAGELALANTHFENPCGFDAPAHRSTANDLLRLARSAAAYPGIAALTASAEVTIASARRSLTLHSTNPMLGRLEGAIGMKSGFTSGAGQCAIVRVQRKGVDVWVVLLNARDRWWTAATLVEDAYRAAQRQ